MSGLQKIMREDCRLQILCLLAHADGYDLNHSIIQHGLAEFGHRPPHDVLINDLLWLQENELITVREVAPFQIAKLTQSGLDVADGRRVVRGVKRPEPQYGG